MTIKEKILRMIAQLPDNVTYDRIAYHLHVMKKIEIGLEQAERGEVVDHDEVFAGLLGDHAKSKNRLDGSSDTGSRGHSAVHHEGRASNGSKLRNATQKIRGKSLEGSRS